MKIKTFVLIAVLIVIAAFAHYFTSPKFTFNSEGDVRKNVFTGGVEVWSSGQWYKREPKPHIKLSQVDQ